MVNTLQMATSDQTYTAEDYEAKNARALVDGTIAGAVGAEGGALAAAAVGALAGSEVPIVGTIIGAVIGIGVYYASDWLFGDAVEQGVRDLNHASDEPTLRADDFPPMMMDF